MCDCLQNDEADKCEAGRKVNYLAHIYLSGKDRRIQIGNFVGDAVKGNTYLHYPFRMRQGILLHRQIDAFSDTHPLVREAVGMGRKVFGRYSAVVMDIFFDYFLAKDFRNYSSVSLNRFAAGFYAALIYNYYYLPSRFRGFLWHFVLTNRLGQYASREGIRCSLQIMSEYRGLRVDSREAMEFLQQNENILHDLFRDFFPQLELRCREELCSGKYK